jgi:tryptophan-rich sensory protein
MPEKRPSRAATGRSFVWTIIVACVATVVVIMWTFHSLSEKQKEHASPSFRM